MKNRIVLPVILCLVSFIGILLPILTPDVGADTPEPVPVLVRINSHPVYMESPALLIGSTTYVPLIDFCGAIMGVPAEAVQDGGLVSVTTPHMTITAAEGDCYISANGRYLFAPTLCIMLDDVLYVPVRPLAKAFGYVLMWDSMNISVSLFTAHGPIEPGETFYDETDLYWMSRIISAEARGECITGKIAVGNVVMNRTRVPDYPDCVYGVIFDRKHAVQFTPAYSGAIHRTPYPSCIIAAKLALEGANVVGDSLFFNVGTQSWAARNREFTIKIGNHNFYA